MSFPRILVSGLASKQPPKTEHFLTEDSQLVSGTQLTELPEGLFSSVNKLLEANASLPMSTRVPGSEVFALLSTD